MARNDDAEAVPRTKRAGRTLSARVAGEPREIAVGKNLSVRHPPHGAHNVELELRPTVEFELDVPERDPFAGEVGPEPLDQLARFRCASVTGACAFRR